MVKYAAKRRFYRRVSKRQFNYIARNYLKYRVKASYQVRFNTTEMTGNHSITFQNILENAPDYALLAKQFLQYKITGVSLDVTPIISPNTNAKACRFAVSIMPVADDGTYQAVSQSPNALSLGDTHCSKYVKIGSAWVSTSEIGLPSMKIVSQYIGALLSGEITYNYLITLYLTFKNPA